MKLSVIRKVVQFIKAEAAEMNEELLLKLQAHSHRIKELETSQLINTTKIKNQVEMIGDLRQALYLVAETGGDLIDTILKELPNIEPNLQRPVSLNNLLGRHQQTLKIAEIEGAPTKLSPKRTPVPTSPEPEQSEEETNGEGEQGNL